MIIVGIDPGFSGGISLFDNGILKDCIVMPIELNKKEKKKINGKVIAQYLKDNKVEMVWIEHVHAFAGQGRTSIWNFGEGVGMIKGVCEALNIKYDQVSPVKWKKTILGEEYDHENKDGTIQFVQKTFPNIDLLASKRCKVPHDGKADSICIGYYGSKII